MLTNEELKGKYIKYSPEITEEMFDKIVNSLSKKGFNQINHCGLGKEYKNLVKEKHICIFEWGADRFVFAIDCTPHQYTEISYKDIIGEENICETCNGEGRVMIAKLYPSGHTEVWEECPDCNGEGYIEEVKSTTQELIVGNWYEIEDNWYRWIFKFKEFKNYTELWSSKCSTPHDGYISKSSGYLTGTPKQCKPADMEEVYKLFPEEKPVKLQLKDLVEGETYKFEWSNTTEYIWKYSTDKAINKVEFLGSFIKPKGIQFTNGILATPEEKQWLNVCIVENKFIKKDIALRDYDINGKALKTESIPEYVEATQNLTGIVIGKIYPYVQNTVIDGKFNNYRDVLTKDDKYFKPSTKELYEAQLQQKEMKEVKFEVGKWYKRDTGTYVKFLKLENNVFIASENISSVDLKYYNVKGTFGNINLKGNTYTLLTDLSEIQQYLPEGHVDKVVKEWWRDLKKGDYVVCIDESYKGCCASKNYIYQNYENGGVWYGNSITSIGSVIPINYNSFRLATPEEIKLYKHAGKPVDITKYKLEVMEEEYKVGDWIVITKHYTYTEEGDIHKINGASCGSDYVDISDSVGQACLPPKSSIRKATEKEIAKVTGETEYFNDLSQHVGRYIKALVDYPNSGSVKKDEIGKILDSNYADFPSQKKYACGGALRELNKNRYELLPENYLPEVKADSKEFVLPEKWCAKADGKDVSKYFDLQSNADCYVRYDYGYLHRFNALNEDITKKGTLTHSFHSSQIRQGFTEITLDQFKKYVLKENKKKPMETFGEIKKDDIVEIVEDNGYGYKKGDIGVVQSRNMSNATILVKGRQSTSALKPYVSFLATSLKKLSSDTVVPDYSEPKKDNMEELLEEAKRRFPIGCTYIPVNDYGDSTDGEIKVEDKSYIPYKYMSKNQIALKDGCGLVYANGNWAEVISSPEESIKKSNLPTDEELLEYANRHYIVGTKFISSISDNGQERECQYYRTSFNWKIENESGNRKVYCANGMKWTSSTCSNPRIYSDKDGWCEITYSPEEKKTNYQFKVGDEVFLPEYGLGKFKDGSIELMDWAENAKIPLNTKLIIHNVVDSGSSLYIKGYTYAHAASKFKPISELNKEVKYNPVEWGFEVVAHRPAEWTVSVYKEDVVKQNVISPILFNVKEI